MGGRYKCIKAAALFFDPWPNPVLCIWPLLLDINSSAEDRAETGLPKKAAYLEFSAGRTRSVESGA